MMQFEKCLVQYFIIEDGRLRFNSEFLKVTVSWTCDHAKFFWLCAKSCDLHAQTNNLCILTSFTVFSSYFTHTRWFIVIFLHFFLQKISNLSFWPWKKIHCRMSDLTLSIIPPSKGYISQYTSLGVYGIIDNEIYEGFISFMTVRSSLRLCPWKLLPTKGYIWQYIPPFVLIRIQ